MHSSDPKKMLHRQVNIRLSDELFKQVSKKAEAVTSSVSQIIREAVLFYLENVVKNK